MKRTQAEKLHRLEREITSYTEVRRRKKKHIILTFYFIMLLILLILLFSFKDAFIHQEITVWTVSIPKHLSPNIGPQGLICS